MNIFRRHVSHRLAALVDGELGSRTARQVELHLAQCSRCRAQREQVRFGMAILDHLPAAHAPEAIWTRIEAALSRQPPYQASVPRWRVAMATLAVVAAAGAAYWKIAYRSGTRWEVVRIHGVPAVQNQPVPNVARIGAGEWIETDSSSRATMKVGAIGSVEVAPNTRLQVVSAQPGEHRLALARGEIRASISAPPRLFFVDTASGTAVDLGCEYSLRSNEEGAGLLQVTRGWVSFQWKGLEALVPAGASCRTWPRAGPGIPYFDDAPEVLKQALESSPPGKLASASLDVILAEARVRDTLTLWHLLSRAGAADRERVYDRMAALAPVPPGVTRENALKLDPETLARWKDELAWTW